MGILGLHWLSILGIRNRLWLCISTRLWLRWDHIYLLAGLGCWILLNMLISNSLSNHMLSLSSVFGACLIGVEFTNMSIVCLDGDCEDEIEPESIVEGNYKSCAFIFRIIHIRIIT